MMGRIPVFAFRWEVAKAVSQHRTVRLPVVFVIAFMSMLLRRNA
jgi:hypothetical protein